MFLKVKEAFLKKWANPDELGTLFNNFSKKNQKLSAVKVTCGFPGFMKVESYLSWTTSHFHLKLRPLALTQTT
jgi:hypothetical protein